MSELKKIPVILDGDPGHDDAIAWVLARASRELDILAVTSCCGNQTIEKTTYNALRVCTLIGLDAPVGKGCPHPLLNDVMNAPSVHGESGLDGPALPEPAFAPSELPAPELMAKVLREAKEPVTIVATGGRTNVATFVCRPVATMVTGSLASRRTFAISSGAGKLGRGRRPAPAAPGRRGPIRRGPRARSSRIVQQRMRAALADRCVQPDERADAQGVVGAFFEWSACRGARGRARVSSSRLRPGQDPRDGRSSVAGVAVEDDGDLLRWTYKAPYLSAAAECSFLARLRRTSEKMTRPMIVTA